MRISICNNKGGVGKSAISLNLAAGLARQGEQVLVVDADSQCNITKKILGEVPDRTIADYLSDLTVKVRVIHTRTTGVDIIPGSFMANDLQLPFAKDAPDAFTRLHSLLTRAKAKYDHVLIDSPPAIGIMMMNALLAADMVIVPITPDDMALDGYDNIKEIVSSIDDGKNRPVKLLVNRYRGQVKGHQFIRATLDRDYPGAAFSTIIREASDISNSMQMGLDAYTYRRSSPSAYQFDLLTKEILKLI